MTGWDHTRYVWGAIAAAVGATYGGSVACLVLASRSRLAGVDGEGDGHPHRVMSDTTRAGSMLR